ncbi:MAG: hypothetical protein HN764_13955 [Gammaproteobacteria bacterium]|nr:hypothetical protein [Gammaproteobacteria bacterium]
MKTAKHLSILISAIVILSTLSSPAHARFKCWTNNEGIKECGEKVPPEYAQKGHQEMSTQGMVLEKKDRAKNKQELAEEARQAELAAKQQKIKDDQDRHDKILLDTFTSIEDIEAVRNDKLAVIESSITLTKKRNEKTQQDLDKRIQAAASAERAGKAPNDALLKDIDLLRERLSNNEAFIKGKHKEEETVNAAAAADIERFKRLKGM